MPGENSTEGSFRPAPFGRYRLVRKLANGGMAELFLARPQGAPETSPPLVIKRLHRHLCDDEHFVRMFLDEARITVRLDHPGIARVLDLGLVDGDYFLALEYVPGPDLERLLELAQRAGAPIPAPLAARMAADLCDALHYAHGFADPAGRPMGIVHRDVSPSNVILGPDGRVRLLDFGIAKAATSSETRSGVVKGKYRYMAPEQARREVIDARTDVFGVGAMLYELTIGRPPFDRASDVAVLRALMEEDPVSPRVVQPEYPPALSRAVLKALEKERVQRHRSAGELRDELERYLAQEAPAGHADLWDFAVRVGAASAPGADTGPRLPTPTVRLGPKARSARKAPPPPAQGPLLGRDGELDRLLALAAQVHATPALAAITGPAGSGKTRVLLELEQRLRGRGFRVLAASGRATRGSRGPLEQLLRVLAGAGRAPPGEAAARLTEVAQSLLGPDGPAAAALAGQLVGLPFDEHPAVRVFRGAERRFHDRAVAAGRILLQAWSRGQPLAILFDDLEPLGEKAGVRLQELVAAWAPPRTVVVVAGPALLAVPDGSLEVQLRPLRTDAIVRLVSDAGAPEDSWDVIAERAAGNPLAALELATLRADGIASAELPSGLQAAVRMRLTRLSAPEREVLARAAILGATFRRGDVAEGERPLQAVDDLAARGILEPVSPGEYRFARPIYRALVDAGLGPDELKVLHRVAAHRLLSDSRPGDLEAAAVHLESAGDTDRAVAALCDAAEKALERFAAREAADAFKAALRLAQGKQMRFRLLAGLEASFSALGERARERESLEQLQALAADLGPKEQAEASLRLLLYLSRVGDAASAADLAPAVIRAKEEVGDARGAGVAHAALARSLLRAGRVVEAARSIARTVRVAVRCGDDALLSDAYLEAGTLRIMQGDYPKAVRHYLRALDRSSRAGAPVQAASSLGNLAEAYLLLGEIDRSVQFRCKALDLARAVGNVRGEALALMNLANTHRLAGSAEEAVATARDAIRLLDAVEDRAHGAIARAYLALGLLGRKAAGDVGEAKRTAEDAIALAQEHQHATAHVEGLVAASLAALEQGEHERAYALSREAARLVEARGPLIEFEAEALYRHHGMMALAGDAPAAAAAIEAAFGRVESAAGRIRDKAARERFLRNVALHRDIVTTHEKWALAAKTRPV